VSPSKIRSLSLLALGGILLAQPLAAQQSGRMGSALNANAPETRPRTEAECRAYAIQRSNEEYLAQDSSVRRNSPFQTGPAAMPDPYTLSQRQQLAMDRAGFEREVYDACIAWLRQQR